MKNILIDIDCPKWVLFFKEFLSHFEKYNINYIITTRGDKNHRENIELLEEYNIPYVKIGYYGKALEEKLKSSLYRQRKLLEIIKKYNITTVISGCSYDANRVAFGLGLENINFYDMPVKNYRYNVKKYIPQARLCIPLSTKVFKPFVVPDKVYIRLGLSKDQVYTYNFLDPLIWLRNFKFDEKYFMENFGKYLNLDFPIVVIREEEIFSSYVNYKNLENTLYFRILRYFYDKRDKYNIVVIPRYKQTYKIYKKYFPKFFILKKVKKIQHLLYKSHIFIGGGGTINIEAAYFGNLVISTRSFLTHYDKYLIDNKLMYHIKNFKQFSNLISSCNSNTTVEKQRKRFCIGNLEREIKNILTKVLNI